MIDNLSVRLVFQSIRQFLITDQFVNDSLEHDVEVLGYKVFLQLTCNGNLMTTFKESIAQIPQFKSLVGEVLVLYLAQTNLTISV